ncbi:MAG: efflux RND transporter periplasmic adaptor subunit [Lachnospiraceae bacterium]|nr:efflux RND transporter periplasmic adaptor subunit [Lachnospiraceae bacterium]
MSRKKKKHTGVKILAVLILAGGAGTFVYFNYGNIFVKSDTSQEVSYKEELVRYGSVVSGISESGTVSFGSSEQTFSVPEVVEVSGSDSSSSSSDTSASVQTSSAQTSGQMNMSGASAGTDMSMTSTGQNTTSSGSTSTGTETSLEVEEIYVSVGQNVSEGDAVMKITQDSIDDYKSDLEAAAASATLQVQQEEINVESKKAEADYTYQMYLVNGETAQETYDATIQSLENTVSDLEEELEDAQDDVDTYQSYVDSGYDYDDELEDAQLVYSTVESNLQIAKNNLTTQSIEAKQTYENAMTNYKYADELYAIDTDGLEDDLEDAQDTLKEAQDALDEFNEEIGDGIIYAEYSGKVTEIAYAAGDTLTSDSTAITYANDDDVTITVAVSQSDISLISIGDTVSVALTAYEDETFSGEVESISSSSSIGSSTVNYDVEVKIAGDTSKIYTGMTGNVTFVEKESTDTLYVSNKAVYQDGSRSYVKVKNEDGSMEEVTVKTEYSNGQTVAVSQGLEEGQTVLIESQVTQ